MSTRTLAGFLLLAVAACGKAEQAELSWRSSDWVHFPFERGEIHHDGGVLYRIEERFERDVAPFGAVEPMAAAFWRFCAISHFTAKKGYKGWALADDPRQKDEPRASTLYFAIGNTPNDLPHNLRSDFREISGFQASCSTFMKQQYHWW